MDETSNSLMCVWLFIQALDISVSFVYICPKICHNDKEEQVT